MDALKKRSGFSLFRGLSLLLFVIICGCASPAAKAVKTPADSPQLHASSAQPGDLLTINSVLLCPLQLGSAAGAEYEKRARWYQQLIDAAQQEMDLKLVTLPAAAAGSALGQDDVSPEQMLQRARRMGADGVLVAEIRRYVEREGSDIGVSKAAIIDLGLRVLRVSDGKKVWEASYHFQDQALSDNLLRVDQSIAHGAHWKTAEELLVQGFRAGARDFSRRRTQQFMQPRQ